MKKLNFFSEKKHEEHISKPALLRIFHVNLKNFIASKSSYFSYRYRLKLNDSAYTYMGV